MRNESGSFRMDRRERLRRCYFHEELDRPAVYSRMWISDEDRSYDRLRALMHERTEIKHWLLAGRYMSSHKTAERVEAVSEDWKRTVYTIHTPAGDLQGSWLESLKGKPGLHETYYLKTREDAEKYLSLPLPTPSGDAATEFAKALKEVGDRGIVEVLLGTNPGGSAVELFGSETFAMMTVTDRDIVHALCERRMKMLLRLVRWLVDQGLGPYFDMEGEEYLVPPLHGPKDFNDFNLKYDKPVVDLVHSAGGRMHIHCHGSVKKVFPGFLEIGPDVLHPFEPPPMGDITAKEAKAFARGRICLEGNIQIANFYERTPGQIREETAALIADCFDDRKGLIVCPTASPYMTGRGEECLPRYEAMIDTVLNWKG
jgi:hypothetical protein